GRDSGPLSEVDAVDAAGIVVRGLAVHSVVPSMGPDSVGALALCRHARLRIARSPDAYAGITGAIYTVPRLAASIHAGLRSALPDDPDGPARRRDSRNRRRGKDGAHGTREANRLEYVAQGLKILRRAAGLRTRV